MTRRFVRGMVILAIYCAAISLPAFDLQAADVRSWSAQQKEEFLRTARIKSTSAARKGITNTLRATLTDGQTTHEASVQIIDDHIAKFEGANGAVEMNFVDSYKFNIAAWKLANLLGIADMMPPSIERKQAGRNASFTWWVDDVLMDQGELLKNKVVVPNQQDWNREVNTMRVFDQLIYNTDRNVGNIVIDKSWRIWMIDHTRAFRTMKTLRDIKLLAYCDRALLAKLRGLDEPTLKKELGAYIGPGEILGLLARRDLIVKFFEGQGEKFLFDRPVRQ